MPLRDMSRNDLDAIARIEAEVHTHPWTRGNFEDALDSGYVCKLHEESGEITGYFVLMRGVEEAELLDIAVAAKCQRKGWGRALLRAVLEAAHGCAAKRVLLEVRRSNVAAQALYLGAGFREIAVRRGYYPAAGGREDAIVMEREL